jgi:glycosyltransferase involved in cell wall biosynthesis/GT2 family glycosyltransferase
MKVVFLVNYNNIGGAEYVSHLHALIARDAGIEVVVLSGTQGFFYDVLRSKGVTVVHLPQLNDRHSEDNMRLLRKHFEGANVVFNCLWLHLNYYIKKLKSRMGFRFYHIIHSNVEYALVASMQHEVIMDRLYVIHNRIKESLIKVGFPKEKIWVIDNAVETDRIPVKDVSIAAGLRKKFKIGRDSVVLGMVTRINFDKNVLDAVRLLHRLVRVHKRDFVLVIIGGPSDWVVSRQYHKKLMDYIKEKHLGKRVIMTGSMGSDDVYHVQQVFDIGLNVSPSEGLPIALLEQMCAGLYCVYPGVGDIPSVLGDRGMVVPIRQRTRGNEIHKYFNYTDEELEQFVNHLLNLDMDVASETGLRAREWILENRGMKVHGEKVLEFLSGGFVSPSAGFGSPSTTLSDRAQPPSLRDRAQPPGFGPSTTLSDRAQPPGFGSPSTTLSDRAQPPVVVSVVMPVCRTKREWLLAAIESVEKQTYRDFEFVLVDDSGKQSTDESLTHFELMDLCRDRGIKYVSTGRNVGMGTALNEGLKHCRGQWIARIDSDDIARPEWLAEQMAFIASTKDVHVVSCQHQAFGNVSWISKHPKKQTAKTVSKYKPGRFWITNHGGTLLRTETLLGVGGYSKELRRRGQDFELWIEYLKQGFAIYTNPKVLYDYRVHDGQPEAAEWWAEYAGGLIEGLSADRGGQGVGTT